MSDSEDEGDLGQRPNQEPIIKLCLLGNGASGKTSIATVLAQNSFNKQYAQTVGLDFFRRRQELPGGKVAQLQIWDVGGQQIGGALLPTYISGAHGILFVYDVTNQQSFDDLEDWMKEAKRVLSSATNNGSSNNQSNATVADPIKLTDESKVTEESQDAPESKVSSAIVPNKAAHFALVGNKTDLQHMIAVKSDQHNKFANDNAMSSHLVCASRSDGIELMIKKITAAILNIKLERGDLEMSQPAVPASVLIKKDISQPPIPSPGSKQRTPQSSNASQSQQPPPSSNSNSVENSNSCSIQ